MGDAIEDLKAVRAFEKDQRRQSWEQRGLTIGALKDMGFPVQALGQDEMHFRIKLAPGTGFVDFWPSTWRWHHKMKGEARPRRTGNGMKLMVEYLHGLGEPKIPQG